MWLHLLEINSSSVHMYICVCFIQNVSRIQYSTWCQNRGCICISSIRTYRIESILHTTILQDRILPKQMGRGPKRDTSQSSNSTRVTTQILHKESNRFPVIPCYSVVFPQEIQWVSVQDRIFILIPRRFFNYKAHSMHTHTMDPPAAVSCGFQAIDTVPSS